jgi:hypothetical protein
MNQVWKRVGMGDTSVANTKTLFSGVELAIRVENIPLALDAVLTVLAEHDVEVIARGQYADRRGSVLLLLTDDPHHAQAILETVGYTCRAEEVLWINCPEYQPGEVARLSHELSLAGIDLQSAYVSVRNGGGCVVVLKTSNNQVAARQFGVPLMEYAA